MKTNENHSNVEVDIIKKRKPLQTYSQIISDKTNTTDTLHDIDTE